MPPRIRKTKSASTVPPAPPLPATPEVAPAPGLTAPAAAPLVFLDLPPPDANIPTVPKGFVPGPSTDYRAVLPRDSELRALPIAVKDLGRFTNYTQVFGETAPPYAEMVQGVAAANAWSPMRTDTAAWDAFCASQEGIAWTTLRAQMEELQSPFDSAKTNLKTLYPGLAGLLAAKTVIAKKGASTRKANATAEANGEPPLHGAVGKKRKKAAQKAAYDAQVNAPVAPVAPTVPTAPGVTTLTQQPGADVAAKPVAAPATTAGGTAPAAATGATPQATAPANGATNGAPNGAPHS